MALLSAGPLRRRLATFATSTGARETVGQKDKLSRDERGYRMACLLAYLLMLLASQDA